MPAKQYHNFCFTSYNTELDPYTENIQYIVWQKEKCPTTGRIHMQGYCELINKQSLGPLSKEFGHIERRRGTQLEAIQYCKKSESRIDGPWEYGEPKKQGKDETLLECINLLKNGGTSLDLLEQFPECYVKHKRNLDEVGGMIARSKTNMFSMPTVHVIIGQAGSGKTRHVYDTEGYENVYKIDDSGGNLWFDGYTGQKVLLIDEFYGGIKYNFLLQMLDGYPLRLPVKGTHTYKGWSTVYITSNDEPDTWYNRGMTDALRRRITDIVHK